MIHGLFGNLSAPEIIDAFGDADVSTPDLVGFGQYRATSTVGLSLQDQAEHVITHINQHHEAPVHLVGHSVGGAVAALIVSSRPDLVASLISVEGNFTLKDAFWSEQIARKSEAEVASIIEGYRCDPDTWMNGAINKPSVLSSRLAREWLANQPASTIKHQAQATIAATAGDEYLKSLRRIMETEMPVHLIAGSRSSSGWDTPAWANELCTSRTNIPDCGHLMMVEAPTRFATAILASIYLGNSL